MTSYECNFCGRLYSKKKPLKFHLMEKHYVEINLRVVDVPWQPRGAPWLITPSSENAAPLPKSPCIEKAAPSPKSQMRCPICKETFLSNYQDLDVHLEQKHALTLDKENHVFNTVADFKSWKTNEEEKEKSCFLQYGSWNRPKKYYKCHCSGISKKNSKLRLNWRRDKKIGLTCPARIVVEIGNTVTVCYIKTHLAHTPQIAELSLRKEDRIVIRSKIEAGVSFNKILKDVRDEASVLGVESMQRIHLLQRKDLHNISAEFHLDEDKLVGNDFSSTKMWLESQSALENSPVIFYKMQGDASSDGILKKQDFMVVIMTTYQKQFLKSATKKILIDSTHGMSGYDYQLTTLMTLDRSAAGVPLAMCLSNRIDEGAMGVFFSAVKKEVGSICPFVFMSDDAPAYWNAWVKIMDHPVHRLLCTWHVKRAWGPHFRQIKDLRKRKITSDQCEALISMSDQNEFQKCIRIFMDQCESDIDLKDFGVYFRRHYFQRMEQWAHCYRWGLELNTNMHLEALHHRLKTYVLEGKKQQRVDKCLAMMLNHSKTVMLEHITRKLKNTPSTKMTKIAKYHRAGAALQTTIAETNEQHTWSIESSSVGGKQHMVRLTGTCNQTPCPLTCPACKTCLHEVNCTCSEYGIRGNMCKHIHAVLLKNPVPDRECRPIDQSTDLEEAAPAGCLSDPFGSQFSKEQFTAQRALAEYAPWVTQLGEDTAPSAKMLKIFKSIQTTHKLWLELMTEKKEEKTKLPTRLNFTKQKRVRSPPSTTTRFVSTKKRRCEEDVSRRGPTSQEKQLIRDEWMDEEKDLYVHSGEDHAYCLTTTVQES